ncbi:hypothetical protein FA13DRAFT_1004949 [Coprinellus micaceus]|uniref:Uncharacterized protein n=1 Tax=Coprinellus micaceus TaxID=71717 RepID=A0A4Y7RPK8_COPMI|nr:hypothetical protein FA13DRAFT_1004949 [Coprinellus micaceus]
MWPFIGVHTILLTHGIFIPVNGEMSLDSSRRHAKTTVESCHHFEHPGRNVVQRHSSCSVSME